MKIKEVLKVKYSSWRELEREIEQIEDTTEKGDAFEQFCYFYFNYFKAVYQIDEIYSPKIDGKDIPYAISKRLRLSKRDDGVDGVFVSLDGSYTAYQVKFRSGRKSPSSNELNNFWAEAEYADNRLVVANCYSLPSDTGKRQNGGSVLVDKFEDLDNNFFEYLYSQTTGDNKIPATKLKPLDFQKPIIQSAVKGFETVNKGKIIAACATGKTLISLWISEALSAETILFFAPNLSLIRQSIERWTMNSNIDFRYLAVCSDMTVASDVDDAFTTELIDIDVPVTTDPDTIARFLSEVKGKRVIFSTYQSVECIIEAVKQLNGFIFDFAVYDEAHRTAGRAEDSLFNLALLDSNIPIEKRLFMTATEKLIKPWIKDKFEQEDLTLFSMDDESVYGPTFHKFTFGEAIKKRIISDYQIIVAGIGDDEIGGLISENRYLRVDEGNGKVISDIPADILFKAFLLGKASAATGAKKIVTFHSSVSGAKMFTNVYSAFSDSFLRKHFNIEKRSSAFLHINGSQRASERSQAFSLFESSEFGMISNVRCLTEGVDMPFIDGIMFADSKGSMIDIVQAVGRALRKPINVDEKTAYIIIPVRVNSDGDYLEDDFTPLHFVIQALRDQDDTLAEWIDELNLNVVKGKGGKALQNKKSKIRLLLPKRVDAAKFANELSIRIATVNSKATGEVGLGSTLGKKQRGSEYKRIFKSIGDYNRQKFQESLVDPTISLFGTDDEVKPRSEIIVNNNNVSHCQRLGVIEKVGSNQFRLTPIGKLYKRNLISFDDIFMNQMLLYTLDEGEKKLFPYRMMLRVLMECSSMNYIEFLYSVYSAQADNEDDEVYRASKMIDYIRSQYPNVMMTSPANHESVREDLNTKHGMSFSERDVWTDRTTSGNQFRFMINHISLFDEYLDVDLKHKIVFIKPDQIDELKKLLEKTKNIYANGECVYGETIWHMRNEEY